MVAFDEFYGHEIRKCDKVINKQIDEERRRANAISNFAFERMNQLEQRVFHEFYDKDPTLMGHSGEIGAHLQVTELENKMMMRDKRLNQIETLKGHFKLRINSKQPMPKKIEKFACEPVAFYLHKKNDFLHRLEGKHNEQKFREEKVFRTMMKNILTQKAASNAKFKAPT